MGNLKLRHGCVLGWGVVQLIYSICMLICGVLLLYWHSVAGYYGVGIWGGVWALITGFLGIVGGVTNNKGVEIAFMVFNILGSVFIYVPMVVVSIATSRYENGCEFDVSQKS